MEVTDIFRLNIEGMRFVLPVEWDEALELNTAVGRYTKTYPFDHLCT